ncbi:hypothetical protein [Candidatus Lokiarchaeum ossiferum]|uniref:hypothetical protein n=1 Tax=Candidatus Lokiarchaeum ossiferum TaxID=2951803 RepID=UPI00352F9E43
MKEILKKVYVKGRKVKKEDGLRTIFIIFIFVFSSEAILYLFEYRNPNYEPYNWGSRNEISYKINECKKLFEENQNKTKILLFGDSVGEMMFNPLQIDLKSKNKTISYNMAFEGVGIRFESFLINLTLKILNPNIIIWQFGHQDFFGLSDINDITLLNTPIGRYHQKNWIETSPVEKNLLDYSRIYRYRIFDIPYHLFQYYQYNRFFENGFRSSIQMMDHFETFKIDVYNKTYIQSVESIFNNTLKFLDKEKVDYFMTSGPIYNTKIIFDKFDHLTQNLPSNKYLDLLENPSFNYTHFSNTYHLNKFGAEIATKQIFNFVEDNFSSFF